MAYRNPTMSGEPQEEGQAKPPYHEHQISCAPPHQSLPASLTLPSLGPIINQQGDHVALQPRLSPPFGESPWSHSLHGSHSTPTINQQGYHVAAQPGTSPPFGESPRPHSLHGSRSSLSHAARSSSFVNRYQQQRYHVATQPRIPPPFAAQSYSFVNRDQQQGYHVAAQPRISPPFGESPWPHSLHGSHSSLSHAAWSSSFVNRDQQVLPAVDTLVSGTSVGEHAVSSVGLRLDPMRTSQHLRLLQANEEHDTSVDDTNNNSGSQGQDSNPTFSLRVRQQPAAARSCGFGDRDRRMVDPPPILQLHVEGPNLVEEEARELIRSPYIVNCEIRDESGSQDFSLLPEDPRQRRLVGSLVGTNFVGKDEFDKEGCFFCFTDLSCRTQGFFRLKFTLVKVDQVRPLGANRLPFLAVVMSDIFTVYTAKDFPGMQPSTRLLKCLKKQGCIVPIKKGHREPKNKRKKKCGDWDSTDEEQEDEDEEQEDEDEEQEDEDEEQEDEEQGDEVFTARKRRP